MSEKKNEAEKLFGKCYDYLNAIIALAGNGASQTEECHAIKTIAIDCSNTLSRIEEAEGRGRKEND